MFPPKRPSRRSRQRDGYRWFLLPVLLVSLVGSSLISCSGDTVNGPAPLGPAKAYWTLQFTQPHAINLALTPPYDTVQLTAVPRNVSGALLPVPGTVTYTATDTTVMVSATGLVRAHAVTNLTYVIATLQDSLQNVTHTDTVAIQVTPTAPPLPIRTFSVQLPSGDSAKRSLDFIQDGSYALIVRATDMSGDTICDTNGCPLLVEYTSSNPQVVKFNKLYSYLHAPYSDTGHVILTAATFAYGEVKADSLLFTVGLSTEPYIGSVNQSEGNDGRSSISQTIYLMQPILVLGVGAVATFVNSSTIVPMDVIFDNPTAVDSALPIYGGQPYGSYSGSGNIPPFFCDSVASGSCSAFGTENLKARLFKVPGTYQFHDSQFPLIKYAFVVRKE